MGKSDKITTYATSAEFTIQRLPFKKVIIQIPYRKAKYRLTVYCFLVNLIFFILRIPVKFELGYVEYLW